MCWLVCRFCMQTHSKRWIHIQSICFCMDQVILGLHISWIYTAVGQASNRQHTSFSTCMQCVTMCPGISAQNVIQFICVNNKINFGQIPTFKFWFRLSIPCHSVFCCQLPHQMSPHKTYVCVCVQKMWPRCTYYVLHSEQMVSLQSIFECVRLWRAHKNCVCVCACVWHDYSSCCSFTFLYIDVFASH